MNCCPDIVKRRARAISDWLHNGRNPQKQDCCTPQDDRLFVSTIDLTITEASQLSLLATDMCPAIYWVESYGFWVSRIPA